MSSEHQELLLVKRPDGRNLDNIWKFQPIEAPTKCIKDNQLVVKVAAFSVDPYLSGVIKSSPLNQPINAYFVGTVVHSTAKEYKEGDEVMSIGPMRTQQIIDVGTSQVHRIGHGTKKLSITAFIGVLGMPGQTGYFGLLDHEVGRMKAGDTVLVSGAAGAVGSIVGQLAKLKGAKRVIGTAGGAEKCRLMKEKYGFDECLDYKQLNTHQLMRDALKTAAPEGINVYFDNTGGHVTDAAYDVLNKFARVAVCGNIVNYFDNGEAKISNLLIKSIYKSINTRGFTVTDFGERLSEFYKEVLPLVEEGKIKFDETIVHGFDKIPEAFEGLFSGKNTGKMVVKL